MVSGEFPFAGDATVDPDRWIETLKDCLTNDVEHVVPGHGPVAGPEAIRRQLELLEALRENTMAAVEAGRDHTAVEVPDMCPVAEGKEWFVEATVERWHAYYMQSGRQR